MGYVPEDYLLLSGLQHFAFCRRQWALIHMEQQWAENRLTAEGEAQHKHAHDEGFTEKRKDLLVIRGLRVSSAELGVAGACDVVEFTKSEQGVPLAGHRGLWTACPVEYKHGKAKQDDSDALQLCGQAMCLEEMLGCSIRTGFVFYHETRRRQEVELTEELRDKVRDALSEMHDYLKRGYTPRPKRGRKCSSCSLKDICLPKISANMPVNAYMARYLEGEES